MSDTYQDVAHIDQPAELEGCTGSIGGPRNLFKRTVVPAPAASPPSLRSFGGFGSAMRRLSKPLVSPASANRPATGRWNGGMIFV